MRKFPLWLALLLSPAATSPVFAEEFGIKFEWGDIPKCTTGSPKYVKNPVFTLSNVPEGTTRIRFNMKDRDAMGFRHGGGDVDYSGQEVIEPGAFKYNGPCPPRGKHTYEWTGTALDSKGQKLGTAKVRKKYP